MGNFIFTSPGIKYRERDLTYITKNLGVTTLGLVGETQKGPAFEPVYTQDSNEFSTRFGSQNIEKFGNGNLKYQLPYVANSYLSESSQLWITRVLGLSGYDAGTGWALTLSAGVNPSSTGATGTGTTGTDNFENNIYLGVALNFVDDTGSYFSGFTKTGAESFEGTLVEFTATTIINGDGTVDTLTTILSGTSYIEYENMILGVIRSRGEVTDAENATPTTSFDATNLAITSNSTNTGIGDIFENITIRASKPADTNDVPEDYIVSLNPNAREYINNVIGYQPKDKNNKIWVESIYPDLIKKLDNDGIVYGVNTTLVDLKSDGYTNYKEQFKTPETPWVVSELRGSDISRLFKFISISDGDNANKETKISILNIDPITKEFDIIIRDFNDTDANIIILESFTRCTLRKSETNYIGQRIGTVDGNYDLKSEYIMLEMNDKHPEDSFPCGFEGYITKDYAVSATTSSSGVNGVAPKLMYKTEYDSDERLNKVYLGVSEKAYDGVSVIGTGINQNLFNYIGQSAFAKTKGFHLDIEATSIYNDGNSLIGEFEVGAGRLRTSADINSSSDTYYEEKSRKFTLVPAGGFDGWNEHRNERSYGDLYRKGGAFDGVADGFTPTNDFQAWDTAIKTFDNPEEVTINLFATPGLNWSDQNIIIKNTIDMIEEQRSDSLYVIDAPDIDIPVTNGDKKQDVIAAEDIVDLLSTADIDSSYSTTYYPWIQMRDDDNNINVWIPPTGEVVKAMAYTDNVKFPWFAPAGLQRGVTDARKSKYKMSSGARDILYKGRINPMADFTDAGTAIFGQKTLQLKESALDRINVRRLLLQIKVLISNIAIRLVFEQNDQTTKDQFITKVNPILDKIKRERGLKEFRIKMDDTINSPESEDRNELYGELFLKPTKALEFIGITFNITPSGASFDDLGA